MEGLPAYPDHDLAGFGANHREAENAVVAPSDKSLHEALCFARRLCAQHRAHRQPRDAHGDALALRIAFAQSHVGKWSVNRQYGTSRSRVLRFPPARLSLMIRKSSTDTCVNWGLPADSPQGPDTQRSRLQPLIDANVATII